MARTTAKKIAGRTAAAVKRVSASVTRKPADGSEKSVPAEKKAPPTKTTSKKTPATKTPATKATAKKAPATKVAAKKAAAPKRTAVKKSAANTAKKTTSSTTEPAAKKVSVRKTTTGTSTSGSTAAKKASAKKTSAKSAGSPRTVSAPAVAPRKQSDRLLAVKSDEKPWTAKELAEVRADLNADRDRLRSELNIAEEELHDLMRDAGDGAGNDQADVGSTTFERDHEMSLANNAREMLAQTEHALVRIDDRTYGVCESCGEPIGKMRLMAFPRATLCLSCKQREERR